MDEPIRVTPDEWNAYVARGERYPIDRTRHYVFAEGMYHDFLGAGMGSSTPPRISELLNASIEPDH